MRVIKGIWKVLVGIKDMLVLLFMLLFFGLIFIGLASSPNPSAIKDGALLLALNGSVVEQPSEVDPLAALSGQEMLAEHRLSDLVRALDAAITDKRVKAVVLDLDRFTGGYPATVANLADAVRRVRDSGKPVLAYATGYTDSGYLLAANASEVWVNPQGGTLFAGPGGAQLYYKTLLDKLGINAHVYRVGTYKSAVEPYTRSDQSPEAKAANQALYGSIFQQWVDRVKQARPKAQVDAFVQRPAELVQAAQGDIATANKNAGLVDQIGERLAFDKRVAQLVGAEPNKAEGTYKTIKMANWINAHPVKQVGSPIGVITIAGEIVDGEGGSGTVGGDTISKLILDALAKKDLKALVVRVDSPGGSALASEKMRQAILAAKAQKLPVVVSMGGLAASGGYWVSTPGDVIFAEPNTITGSIGIFGIIPTFEGTLAKIGVNADGVATTPLTGQPDIYRGTNPTVDAILQSGIERGYARFIGLVAQSRKLTPERVNEIGQGRVWDGGTARQIKLVDRFGNLNDAVAEAAKLAKLDPAKVHPRFLEKEPDPFTQFLAQLTKPSDSDGEASGTDLFARMTAERQAVFAQALGDVRRLIAGPSAGVQARCLECQAYGPVRTQAGDRRAALTLIEGALR
ncbi:signal peptide peptidase SppA [Sphingomonas sp. BGYR3]|uniref:signal peptide peptidase SppA n=1 Tax=Sphingomonas sp. BGYR3 TaxID=2975483 RepID=UPI0021A51CA4|nr:signal peptide peptidase SppA [Sphingomonas sp. BGYR3]